MNKKLTAADEIIQDIASQIVNKQYHPGDKLPNERDLAEGYSVSRGRIREALRALATAGLIEIRSNQGSFVRASNERVQTDVMSWLLHPPHTTFMELFEVREILEKGMYLKAFDLYNNLELDKLEVAYQQLVSIDGKDVALFADAIDQIDRVFAKMTRNPLLINLIETLIVLRRETVERLLKLEGCIANSKLLRGQVVEAFKLRDREKMIESVDAFFVESKKLLAEDD